MGRTLIRGAWIIAQPPSPQAERLDILVEGQRIAAVAPALEADDAEIVDAEGRLIAPGLVNTHLHTWQTALRGIAADWILIQYLMQVHGRAAPLYGPQDMYDGTLAGALNQIDCGTTALGDWCHNNLTPQHTDAAVAALQASGIRAVFLHGSPRPHGPAAPAPAQSRAELERLLKGQLSARDGRLTLGMAIPGPMHGPLDVAEEDLRLAKDLGLVVSMHHSGGPLPPVDPWPILVEKGLLGPHVNIVHGNHLSDENLKRLVDAGVTFTVTPEVEMTDGHGHPITGRLRALGAAPSLGVDIEAAIGGEVLGCARMAMAHQRALDHAADNAGGTGLPAGRLLSAEALGWATREGATALGLGDRVGRIATGAEADLIIIDARALNLWPNNNPVATVLQAHPGNIEGVMIAGEWRKRGGVLSHTDLEGLKQALAATAKRASVAVGLSDTAAN